MRLIDADELKKHQVEGYQANGVELVPIMLVHVSVIDSALTVPNEYMRGYEAAEREYKKPQGTWIPCKSTRTGQITNIDYKCSECFHHKDRPVPYCEICGAKMQKGSA